MNQIKTMPKKLNMAIACLVGIGFTSISDLHAQEDWTRLKKRLDNFVSSSVESESFEHIEAARLLGYIEGVLDLEVPDFWENSLCSSTVNKDEGFVFGSTSFESKFKTSEFKLFWTHGFDVRVNEKGVLLVSKNTEAFAINDYDVDRQSIQLSGRKVLLKTMSLAIINDELVVANWNYNDDTLNVFTVNKEGDIQWDVELEIATHEQNIVSRLVSYGCEICESDSGIIIFGANFSLGFMFCLEPKTGRPLMKFKTNK